MVGAVDAGVAEGEGEAEEEGEGEGEEGGEEEGAEEGAEEAAGGPETRTDAAVGADLAAAGEADGIGATAAGAGGRVLSLPARRLSRLGRSSPSPDGASRYAAGA